MRATFKPSNLQTFKPSNLQTFKPSKLLILLLAALALCLFAGCGFSEEEDSSGSDTGSSTSTSGSVTTSDLNNTTWVATTYATNTSDQSSVSVVATVTFASGSYQIEYSIDGAAGTITRAGTYSITNYSSYSTIYLSPNSSSDTSIRLYYYTTYMESNSFSITLTYDDISVRLSGVTLHFTPQEEGNT